MTQDQRHRLAYLAPGELTNTLLWDLQRHALEHPDQSMREELSADRLLLWSSDAPLPQSPWAQNIWLTPEKVAFQSISEASKKLRAIQRNWVLLPLEHRGRAKLIQDSLPPIRFKPLKFGDPAPSAPLGSWTLLEPNLLLISRHCSSPFPHGEAMFEENQTDPPSRAYLKLWEFFTLIRSHPSSGQRCLDAGASPGGWTWVLKNFGAEVVSVDRSELSPQLMKHALVRFVPGDAFHADIQKYGPFDWIFSDVACYPEKLLDWVQVMLAAYPEASFVCTIKFQHAHGYDALEGFRRIPDSHLLHLSANKHELTWYRLGPTCQEKVDLLSPPDSL